MLKMFNNTIKISTDLVNKITNIIEYQSKQLKKEIKKEINKEISK